MSNKSYSSNIEAKFLLKFFEKNQLNRRMEWSLKKRFSKTS